MWCSWEFVPSQHKSPSLHSKSLDVIQSFSWSWQFDNPQVLIKIAIEMYSLYTSIRKNGLPKLFVKESLVLLENQFRFTSKMSKPALIDAPNNSGIATRTKTSQKHQCKNTITPSNICVYTHIYSLFVVYSWGLCLVLFGFPPLCLLFNLQRLYL